MLKWTLQQRKPETDFLPKRRHSAALKMPSRQSFGVTMESLFRRKSLGCNLPRNERNKENLDVFHRSPFGNPLSPLRDLSNGQSPLRHTESRRRASLDASLVLQNRSSRNTQSASLVLRNSTSQACTLPTFDVEYSPLEESSCLYSNGRSRRNVLDFSDAFVNRRSVLKHASKRHCKIFDPSPSWLNKSLEEKSLSSSRIGDTTLDRMIDAIVASATKNDPKKSVNNSTISIDDDFYEPSIHEMEVKTPPVHHLKRQRVLRRKHKSEPPKDPVPQKLIGLTLPNGIPSPETPQRSSNDQGNFEELASMVTPNIGFAVDMMPNISIKDPQGSSTPTMAETNSIRRCLQFSPDSDDEYLDEKRKSVASSTASSGTFSRSGCIKGSLDLAIFVDNNRLNVHVIRCRELHRPNGSTAVNAYVKVALLPADTGGENGFQRTTVHRNSSRPYFDHRFKFDVQDDKNLTKRIQLAVWHRNRELKVRGQVQLLPDAVEIWAEMTDELFRKNIDTMILPS